MKAMPEVPNATKHGLYTLKKAVARLGNKVINKRYSTGRALAKWRSEIVTDLGGQDNISTQQAAIIDLAVAVACVVSALAMESSSWMAVRQSTSFWTHMETTR